MSKGGFRPNSGRKKGSIPWNKGIHSGNNGNGFKEGQSAWNKGKPMSEESRKKMSISKTEKSIWPNGRILSKETREKMRLAKLGKPSGRKGMKLSPEWRKNMSDAATGKIVSDETRISNRNGQIRRYVRLNPDYVIATRNKRIAINGGFHSKAEWETLKEKYDWTCPACQRREPDVKLTRDHILPILLGGKDDIKNIQPLCQLCNSKKHTQTIRYQT